MNPVRKRRLIITLLILGAVSFLRNEIGNPELLWQQQLMPLVEKAREQLPGTVVGWLPDSGALVRSDVSIPS